VVAVGAVEHYVGVGGLGGEQGGAVQVTVYQADFGVLGCDFGAFVAVWASVVRSRHGAVVTDLLRTSAVISRSGYVFATAYRASPPI
jgi:hypothetical protein